MRLGAALLRSIPLDDRGKRALDEVLADWEHESALASGLQRLGVNLRAGGAVATALALVIVRYGMPTHFSTNWKRALLGATCLAAIISAVWVQLPARYTSGVPELVENLSPGEMGAAAAVRIRGRVIDVTGVVMSATANRRGFDFVRLANPSGGDTPHGRRLLRLDSSVDPSSLVIGQVITLRCQPPDTVPRGLYFNAYFGSCRPLRMQS